MSVEPSLRINLGAYQVGGMFLLCGLQVDCGTGPEAQIRSAHLVFCRDQTKFETSNAGEIKVFSIFKLFLYSGLLYQKLTIFIYLLIHSLIHTLILASSVLQESEDDCWEDEEEDGQANGDGNLANMFAPAAAFPGYDADTVDDEEDPDAVSGWRSGRGVLVGVVKGLWGEEEDGYGC